MYGENGTRVDYEMTDSDGKQVFFVRKDEDGSVGISSHCSDMEEAITQRGEGMKLYRRTITTSYEEVA